MTTKIEQGHFYTLDHGLVRQVMDHSELVALFHRYNGKPAVIARSIFLTPFDKPSKPSVRVITAFLFQSVDTPEGPALFETVVEYTPPRAPTKQANLWAPSNPRKVMGAANTLEDALALHKLHEETLRQTDPSLELVAIHSPQAFSFTGKPV